MALAPFFEKNAVAAAQLLRGYDKVSFERCLTQRSPAIIFDGSAAQGGMAKLVTELLVNLIARLYPAVALVPLDESARAYEMELRELATAINPAVDFIEPRADALQLVLGKSKPPASRGERPLFIGAEGWSGMLSRTDSVRLDKTANPFGGGMAACLAAANAFRHTFADQLERAELDGEVEISVADVLGAPEAPPAGPIEIGRTHLVGAGAVGQAFWKLSTMKRSNSPMCSVTFSPRLATWGSGRSILPCLAAILRCTSANKRGANSWLRHDLHCWTGYSSQSILQRRAAPFRRRCLGES
jgi:hypothetical protein